MIETIKHVDKYIGLLMALLDNAELSSSLNIIIASDHGMTEVSNERSINLGEYVDFKEDVKWSYTSVIGIVWPNEGKHQKVLYSKYRNTTGRSSQYVHICTHY